MQNTQPKGRRLQRGLTGLGWLMFLVLMALLLSVGLKLGPHYIDYRTVNSVINSLPSDSHQLDKGEIRELLDKRFRINSLRDLPSKEVLKIERTRDNTILHLFYEVREHIVLNIDAVLTFKKDYVFNPK